MVVHPPVDLRKWWTLIEDFEHGETFDGPPRSTYGPPAYQYSPTLITNSMESKWLQMVTRRKNSENQWKNGGRRGIRTPDQRRVKPLRYRCAIILSKLRRLLVKSIYFATQSGTNLTRNCVKSV